MTFCGYNDEMGQGLAMFAGGVAKAIADKAVERGVPLEKQIADEQDQMVLLRNFIEAKIDATSKNPKDKNFLSILSFLGATCVAEALILAYQDYAGFDEQQLRATLIQYADELASKIKYFDAEYENEPQNISSILRLQTAFDKVLSGTQR